MAKWKKGIGILLGIVVMAAVLMLVNFAPTFRLERKGMKKLEGDWINVYYETEEAAAEDVFSYADSQTADIAERLGFAEKQEVNVYIYDKQSTMQTKKYGLIAPLLGLDWYIGDNIGTDVILTSPANPGKVHDYDNNKYAVLHEIVQAYGWDAVLLLIETEDYEKCFGRSRETVYNEWVNYIEHYPQ